MHVSFKEDQDMHVIDLSLRCKFEFLPNGNLVKKGLIWWISGCMLWSRWNSIVLRNLVGVLDENEVFDIMMSWNWIACKHVCMIWFELLLIKWDVSLIVGLC